MAVTWSIAQVQWEAVEGSATDVLITYVHWSTEDTAPNPDYDAQGPLSGPEFLSGVQTGVLDFRYDNFVYTRAQTETVTQSQIVTWVQNKLGPTRVAAIEAETTADLNDVLLPPKGDFVPAPDP